MRTYIKGALASAALGFLLLVAGTAQAATMNLFEWAYNQDGAISSTYSGSGFDSATGLGTLNFTVSGAGAHSFIAYFDHEIDELVNTFFNESGSVHGSAAAGQSWEIDEPGYVFGNIHDNFLAGTLDNLNNVPATAPDDVSMALGWNFSLLAGETATITYLLSDSTRPGGFYLEQFDPDSQASIFFSSTMTIQGGGTPPVPEPSTLLLLGAGLAGLGFYGRRGKKIT